jgi:hypothetical protein
MAKLKRYRLTAEITISVTCFVEARSVKHAREIAEAAEKQTLCHSCSSENDPECPEWRASELDGDPKIIEVQEEDDA